MSLTIDNGSTVYFLRSSNEIKSVRIDSGSNYISYHTEPRKELSRSSTAVSSVSCDPSNAVYMDYAPIELKIKDISELPPTGTETVSLRQASAELLRLVGKNTRRLAVASGNGLRKLWRKTKKNGKTSMRKVKGHKVAAS